MVVGYSCIAGLTVGTLVLTWLPPDPITLQMVGNMVANIIGGDSKNIFHEMTYFCSCVIAEGAYSNKQ